MYTVWYRKEGTDTRCLFMSSVPQPIAHRIAINLTEEFGVEAWTEED